MIKKVLITAALFALFMLVLSWCLNMLSASDSIENVLGFFGIVVIVSVSVQALISEIIKFKEGDKGKDK